MTDIDVLILRLEAPLLSFGVVAVDEKRSTGEVPSRSMVCGLLANALGWRHGDFDRLNRLQDRLVIATRRDRKGNLLDDFQTVDLGQDFLQHGWTTSHRPATRQGAAGRTTHIRRREYLADTAYTVAVALDPDDEEPTLEQLRNAVLRPARPLFLGRKACLPSRPLVGHRDWPDRVRAASVAEALRDLPHWAEPADSSCMLWWPDGLASAPASEHRFPVTEDRDWRNQNHAGRRILCQARVEPPARPPKEEVAGA